MEKAAKVTVKLYNRFADSGRGAVSLVSFGYIGVLYAEPSGQISQISHIHSPPAMSWQYTPLVP